MAAVSFLYLIRHGEARGAEKRCIGRTDLPLTVEGYSQAEKLAHLLQNMPVDSLLYSPLERTRETARVISETCQITSMAYDSLLEIDMGDWDGLPFAEIQHRWPEAYLQRGHDFANFRPPKTQPVSGLRCHGESFADVADRAVPVLIQHATTVLPKHTAIVTHAGVIRACLCHITATPLQDIFRFHIPTGSITTLCHYRNKLKIQTIGLQP